jgi:type IV pilus assembly protein PilX
MIRKPLPRRQRGAVLVIGLLLLVILTVLSTSAMQSTALQERMAGNNRDRNLAFQAAEAALRDAEQYIRSDVAPFAPFQPNSFTTSGANGLYDSKANPGSFSLYNDLADSTKTLLFGTGMSEAALPEVAAQPRYLIELLATTCSGSEQNALFRVTARAQGANANTLVTLQSRYRRGIPCAGGSSDAATGGDDTTPSI